MRTLAFVIFALLPSCAIGPIALNYDPESKQTSLNVSLKPTHGKDVITN